MSVRQTNNLVVVSDLHCGCKLGLYPFDGDVPLTFGVGYKPSGFQYKLWEYWREFWDVWIHEWRNDEPVMVVFNGDIIDNVHHKATTPISTDISDHARIAKTIIQKVVDLPFVSGIYIVRGTEVHDGMGGSDSERIAEELGAIPDSEGHYARFFLLKIVGDPNGRNCLVDCLHHIGTTGRTHYETSGPHGELGETFVEAARWQHRPPDYVVRSHRHRHVETKFATANGMARAIVTPGWQGKTPFIYKINARNSQPQFGGIMVRQGDRTHYAVEKVWSLERPQPE